MEYDARKHAAGKWESGLTRGVVNRAQMAVAFKESTRAVGATRGVAFFGEHTTGKPKRMNAFAFRMSERNRPAGAAARAGMAAAVSRMKGQTLRHCVFNHGNADYRTVAFPEAGYREPE